jgi:hypothetical protein
LIQPEAEPQKEASMKASRMPVVVAVAMLGAAGILELSDQAFAQPQQQELQQPVISQPALSPYIVTRYPKASAT